MAVFGLEAGQALVATVNHGAHTFQAAVHDLFQFALADLKNSVVGSDPEAAVCVCCDL